MFAGTASITLCPLTTHLVDAPFIRLSIEPTKQNGLNGPSHVMVDKITTVPKTKVQKRIGKLADQDMVRLSRAVVVFLASLDIQKTNLANTIASPRVAGRSHL